MAAIFDLLVTPMSDSVHTSPAVFLDPKMWSNLWDSIAVMDRSGDNSLFHIYCRLMAAIFDSPFTPISHSVNMSPVVFLDHKNAGLVLRFPLLPCIEAET